MVMATSASFWKTYGPMIPPDQNSHQTVTFSGCIWSWCILRGLISSQIRQFCLFTYPFIQKWTSSLKMICLAKFGLTSNCSRTQSANTRRCVWLFKFLGQLNFIGVQTQVPTQNSPSWSRRKAKFLWTPRVFPYTFTCVSRTAAMFSADLRFGDVLVLADYLSNQLTRIWPPNVRIVDSAGRGRLWWG